jgi:hypothetical protein
MFPCWRGRERFSPSIRIPWRGSKIARACALNGLRIADNAKAAGGSYDGFQRSRFGGWGLGGSGPPLIQTRSPDGGFGGPRGVQKVPCDLKSLKELALAVLVPWPASNGCPMNALEKKILAVGMLSVLACYLLSTVLTSLGSIKGALDPRRAKAAVVGGKAAPSK